MTDTAPKPLVSVERQVETDLATGTTETRLFLKMYFEARDTGLLADIGDRRWRTLCCMATYMSENGLCFPSQARIASDLGIHRQRANERIQELLRYRFNGRPVIALERRRLKTKSGERWASNVYRILPISGLGIFGSDPVSENPDTRAMSGKPDTGHRPMSGKPDTGDPDTNKNHDLNQTHTPGVFHESDAAKLVQLFHATRGSAHQPSTRREIEQASELIRRLGARGARGVVDFAFSEARKTKFEMRHFGAVLGYEAEAASADQKRTRAERARRDRDEHKRQGDEELEYTAWRDGELEARFTAFSPQERSAIRDEAESIVTKTRGSTAFGFETLVRLEIRRKVSERLSGPTLDEWRSLRANALRRVSGE